MENSPMSNLAPQTCGTTMELKRSYPSSRFSPIKNTVMTSRRHTLLGFSTNRCSLKLGSSRKKLRDDEIINNCL
ncbi:hypothetical protein EUGRSUZ_A00655 [Eucalyptus grandis]|uniref:Uncharacterized protein n=2 Tax=Eucalyptus grandis TaxID=71139 RepID=A0ACC3M0N7_EUCGR|nr:hypothetical protein EUGRSUZ_A00655 [Eucalyptus grandis]